MVKILKDIVIVAKELDSLGMHREADALSRIITSQGVMNNLNVPVKNRVVPWDIDFDDELGERDEKRKDHPRYHPHYYDIDSPGDTKDKETSIFSLNGPDDVTGPGFILHDPNSAGMMGGNMDSFEYENRNNRNDNSADRYKNLLPH